MFTAFFFYLFVGLVLVNANNEFLNPPPDGINIPRDPPFIVRWRCDDCGTTPIYLHVFQDNGDTTWSLETLIDGVATSESRGNYSWTPHTFGDLTIANGFHFNINFGEKVFDSGSIFITDSPSSSSVATSIITTTIINTSPISASTSLITPTSSAPNIPLSSSTTLAPTTSALAPTDPSPINSEALRVGLGVGLGVGIPFLLLIGGIAGYILFRRRSSARQNTTYQSDDVKLALPSYEVEGQVLEPRRDEWPHELDEYRGPSELHG